MIKLEPHVKDQTLELVGNRDEMYRISEQKANQRRNPVC